MFGLTEYLAAGALGISVTWGGYHAIRSANLEADLTSAESRLSSALGAFETCKSRIENIKEAQESNAEIPDDLLEFDIPTHWMLEGSGGADPSSD